MSELKSFIVKSELHDKVKQKALHNNEKIKVFVERALNKELALKNKTVIKKKTIVKKKTTIKKK